MGLLKSVKTRSLYSHRINPCILFSFPFYIFFLWFFPPFLFSSHFCFLPSFFPLFVLLFPSLICLLFFNVYFIFLFPLLIYLLFLLMLILGSRVSLSPLIISLFLLVSFVSLFLHWSLCFLFLFFWFFFFVSLPLFGFFLFYYYIFILLFIYLFFGVGLFSPILPIALLFIYLFSFLPSSGQLVLMMSLVCDSTCKLWIYLQYSVL